MEHVWLIPALPLAAALLIGLFGKWLKGWSHIPAILAMIGSSVVALMLLKGFSAGELKADQVKLFDWIHVGSLQLNFAFYVDQLTALYLTFITVIGTLIFIYASGYMKGDYGYFRFFAYLSLFAFFMTTLVLANNFALLYLGWEGVGLASYLLIGYYYPRPSAVAAAKKAFITNRIGDFGFAIGIFLIYKTFSTLNFFSSPHSPGVFDLVAGFSNRPDLDLTFKYIPFLLMVGAFGKSAQFPLHVWLPDAMEGPTPVSALIHAATMVTAGVYMIARCMPLFNESPAALLCVAVIGCFTAFLAATIALCQYDLKRIWAYSTLSQLGYMFLGLGVGATASGVFHVFTHAWFKALLFLSAGSVMHAMGGELDLRKMSGLRKVMPITTVLMLIGCLALAGFPGFAGFFSKDEIIEAAINSDNQFWWILGGTALLVALLTSYYTFRLFFRVFMGPLVLPETAGHHEPSPFALEDGHGHAHEAHAPEDAGHGHASGHASETGHDAAHGAHGPSDGSIVLWGPLVILAIGAVLAGYAGVFGGAGAHEGGWIHEFLGQSRSLAGNEESGVEHVPHTVMKVLSYIIPVAGILLAWYFHLANRPAAATMAARLRPIQRFLENKWYWDEIYRDLLLKPLRILAHFLAFFDKYVVDILVFLVAFAPQVIGYWLKPTQRGLLQRYAVGMIAGVVAVVLGVLYVLR